MRSMKRLEAERATCLHGKTGSAPAIEMKNIVVRFEAKTVLDGFSLRLMPGEKLVLTGESGVGKSTVLKCILGFVIPAEGEIFIQGKRLTHDSVWTLRTLLSYVPQEPELGDGTLHEWFRSPFFFRANTSLRNNLDRLPGFLERFSLSQELLHKEVGALSGGEKQRAALISAILLERKIFLLDEPTSALDSKNGKKVLEFLFANPDVSILAVSHDHAFLDEADRVVELSARGGKNAY
ncbi:MAG: ATP-binding cassette domain-containing protein [Deltaproteobacteria bacterium]|nr:ATP-binding cassette domain-containing protein [Deltaproteobacteria bacterium]MBW1950933.1 ATP-binding cassette domain-containing protein [Deltaproteobacteria bacterium]MBW2006738.1 ATP-binding cassette domain-containing protein [Deltaproteobacteria bacterium]RLB31216.1 MAG: ABC transporter ATP-binding protein [Deltaproteobacteria bacterium]